MAAPEKLYLIQHNGLVCYCRNNKDDIEYTDAVLNDWKERLHADEYTVTAKQNQLTVKFSVHYDKEKATQGR